MSFSSPHKNIQKNCFSQSVPTASHHTCQTETVTATHQTAPVRVRVLHAVGPRAARRISRRRRRRRRKSPAPPTCPKCRRPRAFRGLEDVMMWAEVVLGGLRSGDSAEGGRFFQRVGGWLRDFVCFLDLLSCCTDCSNSLGG